MGMARDLKKELSKRLKATGMNIPVISDPLLLLAKGTDASFYRLKPKLIVQVNNEAEIRQVLKICHDMTVPVTFKAGGTSLSGQTITESVLVEIGPGFSGHSIRGNGNIASFQPGVRGGFANILLSRYGRKIGPSPASINAAKIGGIVANNASGSSYGIATNSYNTIRGMRIIFADGTLLDTSDEGSRADFRKTHAELLEKISSIRGRILNSKKVSEKIRSKFQLKNTCGYGVNSLVDFDDPIDIVEHLMVGSEGTLGFISDVTFETIPDYPFKACSLLYLPSIREAAAAVMPLRECSVSAAELMDRNALRSVENNAGMPALLKDLDENSAALLIETSAPTDILLAQQMEEIREKLAEIKTLHPVWFTVDKMEFDSIWKVRKGLFTSAAAARPKGTACIIEDVAFPGEVLGDALTDLQELLVRFNYRYSVIWGHLLDGNIHFLVTPDFSEEKQMLEYKSFMHELSRFVIGKYNGSLKGEHGTGRNMAPFVKFEWGDVVYDIMKEIKAAFDPKNILNSGVLINDDDEVFAKNIKPLPQVNPIVDDCIECGFCETNCPSRELTLTPRQRIVVHREIIRLRDTGNRKELRQLEKAFSYQGDKTCATDGLCAVECPVGINTGNLVKELRFYNRGGFTKFIAEQIARNTAGTVAFARMMLSLVYGIRFVLTAKVMKSVTGFLYRASFHAIPLWNEYIPKNSLSIKKILPVNEGNPLKVVYFPACINRIFGISADYNLRESVTQKTISLLKKAGYEILFPSDLENLCCGMAFDSKGYKEQGLRKLQELEKRLLDISRNGEIPVLCDMSPCLYRMKTLMNEKLRLYEPIEFTLTFLSARLDFRKLPVTVSVHSTCSSTKMGLEEQLVKLAGMCAEKVVRPLKTGCCGWAGDKGFSVPKLNASALKYLKEEIPEGVSGGYSTSRTCEIGLSLHSGISYKSILYLVDEATDTR